MKITYFKSPAELRKWFAKNHRTQTELWVGFHKKASGVPSITWPESVDEALCVGWIDGIRKSVDEDRYTIRFTPRRTGSVWSAVNIRRVKALSEEGRMRPEGLKAFELRRENRSGIYSYENRPAEFGEPYLGILQKNAKAWAFYQKQPPSYKKMVAWYIITAKKEETRLERLRDLMKRWAQGRTGRER